MISAYTVAGFHLLTYRRFIPLDWGEPMMMQRHLIARIALVLLLLCSASVSWGENTSIQNGESGLSVRNKLNTLLGTVFNVKQPPYNAAGNGSANDYNAIQNAIND